MLISQEKETLKYADKLQFPATNNEAEYEALLTGLSLAKALGANNLVVQAYSQLIIGQVKGDYEAKEERMQKYLRIIQRLSQHFDNLNFVQIPRAKNAEANFLARLASLDDYSATSELCVEIKGQPSIEGEQILTIKEQDEWIAPIVRYLKKGWLPEDKTEARKIQIRAARFVIIDDVLYRRGYSLLYLICASLKEADYVHREIHEGTCKNHAGARSLAGKALRAGYYWPTLQKDAYNIVRACDKCQRFANVQTGPRETMTPISSPWPFAQWGIDIMGPFPLGKKKLKFLIIAIVYFKKWVEAKLVMMIIEAKVSSFVWKNIICRFRVPHFIISDNGKQFDNLKFQKFYQDLGVKNQYSSPRHPHANGQTKVTNRSLLKIIKTRLEGAKGAWPEELQNVLWAYRTTTRVPTRETPFRLTFGTEAVISMEVGLTSYRVKNI